MPRQRAYHGPSTRIADGLPEREPAKHRIVPA